MRARSILAPILLMTAASGSACSQTPVVVPLRSMERPRDVDFICLAETGHGTWKGVSLEKCAATFDAKPANEGSFRLHAVVSQVSRGEVAVVDLGRVPTDAATLTKADPRIPGYSFIPVGATPTDVVADPMGGAVFVSSGRDPRIDVLPSEILRGPIDTRASSGDPPPWPHLDFDRATEGIPSAMAIVREGDQRRLYVTLPEATPSAKIAVFDLGKDPNDPATATVPARVGDIPLGAPAPAPLVVKQPVCGPNGELAPWWAAYDKCVGATTVMPGGEVTPDTTTTDFHLAGVAVAGGRMFVADDHAPVIHVYDVKGGAGLEIRRIAIGSATSRLAVSPVVPDEVTIQNSAAIDVCIANNWLGDGLNHSDNALIKDRLGGRCRAHRYLYAIDLVDSEGGNGSIAIVDLPVTFALDDQNQIKLKDGTNPEDFVPAEERIDIDGAELVAPMACDAPSFPARRLPIGPFGLHGNNVVPARSVAFIEIDPPKTADKKYRAVRCRPFESHPLDGAREFEGVDPTEADDRKVIGKAWSEGAGPRRLRGVYAWVALANGALVVVDIDDYDSTCRGPKADDAQRAAQQQFLYPGEKVTGLSNTDDKGNVVSTATDEYYSHVVQRHHPRSTRLFDDNLVPAVTGVTFSRFDNVISNDPTNETGRTYPHFAALGERAGEALRAPLVLAAPDNPYAISSENWAVTYEGQLPGFTGAFGELNEAGGVLALKDPAAGFCRKGVESNGAVEQHDIVQLVDEMCQFDSCTQAQLDDCNAYFGDTAQTPLRRGRSLLIEKATDDRLVIANKHWNRDQQLVDGPPELAKIKQCFGNGLLKYTIRSTGSWVVVGSTTGYLHRQIVDPTSTDKACITDTSKPRILNGRAFEQPPLTGDKLTKSRTPIEDKENIISDDCLRFINPSWKFAIRTGALCKESSGILNCSANPSQQDMRFTFGGRFSWQPLSLAAGSLTASMRPISAYWDGVEHLGWNMIAVVDAVDRGLLIFPANEPFAYQKGAN